MSCMDGLRTSRSMSLEFKCAWTGLHHVWTTWSVSPGFECVWTGHPDVRTMQPESLEERSTFGVSRRPTYLSRQAWVENG
jgi:hypothetical protein